MLKTFTFALVHVSVAFTVGYLLTGSASAGGGVALIEPACNTVAYPLHEKAWAALRRSPVAGYAEPRPAGGFRPTGPPISNSPATIR